MTYDIAPNQWTYFSKLYSDTLSTAGKNADSSGVYPVGAFRSRALLIFPVGVTAVAGTAVWLVYAAIGLAIECYALARPASGDTLSEQVWGLFSHPTFGKFAAWMLTAFLVWLMVHFVSKGRLG